MAFAESVIVDLDPVKVVDLLADSVVAVALTEASKGDT